MLQSPAIFLQHSISEGVICVLGRQASAGVPIHRKSKPAATMECNFDTMGMLPVGPSPRKEVVVGGGQHLSWTMSRVYQVRKKKRGARYVSRLRSGPPLRLRVESFQHRDPAQAVL
jgi:hypothetical protein